MPAIPGDITNYILRTIRNTIIIPFTMAKTGSILLAMMRTQIKIIMVRELIPAYQMEITRVPIQPMPLPLSVGHALTRPILLPLPAGRILTHPIHLLVGHALTHPILPPEDHELTLTTH